MISLASWLGRARFGDFETPGSVPAILYPELARLWCLTSTVTAATRTLPGALRFKRPGGPIIVVVNDGSQNIAIQDRALNPITTVVPGTAALFYLLDNTTTAGLWRVETRAVVA